MISIPRQLKDWRFILVNKCGACDPKGKPIDKAAFEKKWQTNNNYTIDHPKLNAWLRESGNYGVLPLGRNLIIDIDRNGMGELRDRVIQGFGPTFTVNTPHGGEHRYYVMDRDQESLNIPLIAFKAGENIGHLRTGA